VWPNAAHWRNGFEHACVLGPLLHVSPATPPALQPGNLALTAAVCLDPQALLLLLLLLLLRAAVAAAASLLALQLLLTGALLALLLLLLLLTVMVLWWPLRSW
jgi:hypothetical protein